MANTWGRPQFWLNFNFCDSFHLKSIHTYRKLPSNTNRGISSSSGNDNLEGVVLHCITKSECGLREAEEWDVGSWSGFYMFWTKRSQKKWNHFYHKQWINKTLLIIAIKADKKTKNYWKYWNKVPDSRSQPTIYGTIWQTMAQCRKEGFRLKPVSRVAAQAHKQQVVPESKSPIPWLSREVRFGLIQTYVWQFKVLRKRCISWNF